MSAWPRENILAALAGAKTRGEISAADGVVIDTRRITPGDMFLAFRGEHVDGHDYLDHAAQQGAVFAVVEEFQDHPLPQIRVPIMRDALWQLARYARRQHSKTRFIAITGSVGKTSTRSLMQQGFSAAHAVYASQGNFNNNLGMPLCLAQMGCMMRWDAAIFELGMNVSGEIALLSQLLRPDIALILNVYAVHQANFPNLEAIAAAKAEICTGLRS
ncbi:MAG: UDP-N-acetylmuramoylalanyl-D-glutamyl-2, 6-diaminopimelate--D-alanyl-D-alanine ligase, partial [Alphaproteobacteria bacterium]|nr:UDP-N-acetylmuramoylalanyl-D-glutamyl-2, 6-diaminopimelate--D-alanyl-D-alanine ligase [Alphaproteobacteria bacterium]